MCDAYGADTRASMRLFVSCVCEDEATGIKTWRRARFGLINSLLMSRLSEVGEMFRYSAACLISSARGLIEAQLGDIVTYHNIPLSEPLSTEMLLC